MPLSEKDNVLSHFAQMELAYSALLDSPDLADYGDACSILKLPLSKLFYNAYIDSHPREELAVVDLVEFLGGFFLHDSQGCYDAEAASRVVGAIGISQETPNLKELVGRLRNARRTGESAESTLELIRMALWVAEDTASPKNLQALRQAISTALGTQKAGLAGAFEDIARQASYPSPLSYRSSRYLRALTRLILGDPAIECVADKLALPRKGHTLAQGFWDNLRDLVETADRRLSEAQKSSLVELLGGFRPAAAKELVASLRSPTEHLLTLVEQYVCPLVDVGQGRPRNNQAQRSMRLKKATKHLYDIGHFLPHSAGGPKDINFFVQERRLNRGWSKEGKRYRWLENLVFSRPGTLFFVRPVYIDLSPIPRYLEWGALLEDAFIEEIATDVSEMPEVHFVGPGTHERRGPGLSWLISVFENFGVVAIKELMESAEG